MKVFVRTRDAGFVPEVMNLHKTTEGHVADVDERVVIADLPEDEIAGLKQSDHFDVFDDIQFQLFPDPPSWWEREEEKVLPAAPPPWLGKTQADVMAHIRVPEARALATGDGVTIAVVDSGTDGSMREFPRRSPASVAPSFSTPWEDSVGHGTMCAAIACGSDETGGRYKGVAPAAALLSARSTLKATDLYLIYQRLLAGKKAGAFSKGLVVSNSYGLYRCSAPAGLPENHPYVDLVRLCAADGIVFVFAAGNNHASGLCKHPEAADAPNTIWSVNSIDEVITVGTVDWDESNQKPGAEHANSSRGPGQWSVRRDKPDVVAPTYGEVAWGGGYRHMEWWGTSGACPQVAGLAALLLSKRPSLKPADVASIMKASARRLPGRPAACVGAGVIDCLEALRSA